MIRMVRDSRGWTFAAVVALAAFTAVSGLCLFGGHDHGSAFNLCFVFLAATLIVPALASLPPAGWASGDRFAYASAAGPHTPAPPPKSRSLL